MINVDVCPVEDEEQALVLMVHHLQLAATYFEASPTEIDRGAFIDAVGWSGGPALDWLERMDREADDR